MMADKNTISKQASKQGDQGLQLGVNGNEAANNNIASPETGDSSIAIWIAVMFAAGAALTGAALYSRKKK